MAYKNVLGETQGFTLEIPQSRVSRQSSEGGVVKTIGKVIIGLVLIGAVILLLPFVFCGTWLISMSLGPLGVTIGLAIAIGVTIAFFMGAIKVISKVFKNNG